MPQPISLLIGFIVLSVVFGLISGDGPQSNTMFGTLYMPNDQLQHFGVGERILRSFFPAAAVPVPAGSFWSARAA